MNNKNGFKIKNKTKPAAISDGAYRIAREETTRRRRAGYSASIKSVISEAVVKTFGATPNND